MSLSSRMLASGAVVAALAVSFCAAAAAREVVPAPPGGGPGVRLWAADQESPRDLPAPDLTLPVARRLPAAPPGGRDPDLGGDDVSVSGSVAAYDADLAVTAGGELYALYWYDVAPGDNVYRFAVRRSSDGGTTWWTWATFVPPAGQRYWHPQILIAEGVEDRCYVTYVVDTGTGRPTDVHVAWSPLDAPAGDFADILLYAAEETAYSPRLVTDAASWDEYYLYLAFCADDGDGGDIMFARSTDQGDSWEAPYMIAEIVVGDRSYGAPAICVGYGGWVHVGWVLYFGLLADLCG